ncbi:protein of unknown function [Cupriavidus taiwanensis]|uniref:Uncharacterized protein n=1 Tax=Cupriavidus taiwanensis TaxID=164546 RepID=A0A375IGJ9_9BURK|nr:protein of unknown function [Cupriavidus taiwanensis]
MQDGECRIAPCGKHLHKVFGVGLAQGEAIEQALSLQLLESLLVLAQWKSEQVTADLRAVCLPPGLQA